MAPRLAPKNRETTISGLALATSKAKKHKSAARKIKGPRVDWPCKGMDSRAKALSGKGWKGLLSTGHQVPNVGNHLPRKKASETTGACETQLLGGTTKTLRGQVVSGHLVSA